MNHPVIKKFLFTYHVFLCLAVAAGGFLLIQNIWMDSVLANVIGERWKVHLASDGARIQNLSTISFETLRVVSAKGEVLAAFKNGSVQIRPVFFLGNEAKAAFESVTLQNYFFQRLPSFLSPIYHLTKKSLVAKPVRLFAHRRGAALFLHLEPLQCEAVCFRGGFLFQDGALAKAHLVVYLSAKPRTRLLKNLFERMTPQRDGSRKVRFVLSKNTFVIHGRTGPLFRADWVLAE